MNKKSNRGGDEMRELDNEFFEEYKRLDKLCREIFGSEKGVGEYINQMESIATQGRRNVPTWDRDYTRLKRWRWLRNQLAHDESAVCEEEDLVQLQGFYDRIFAIEDPLAILRKEERRKESSKPSQMPVTPTYRSKAKKKTNVGFILTLAILAVLFLVFTFKLTMGV